MTPGTIGFTLRNLFGRRSTEESPELSPEPEPSGSPETGRDRAAIESIFAAAACGDPRSVAAHLDAGTDPNISNDVAPLLHLALAASDSATLEGRMKVVSLLLDRGAELEPRDRNGWTALLTALDAGQKDMIRLLLNRGADPDAADDKGWSAFHYLANREADPSLFGLLAEAGADPNARSRAEGNTPLMIAVDKNSAAPTRALLEIGADAGIARNDHLTALHMAVIHGNVKLARLLLEAGADANARGIGNGGVALHVAAGQGNLPMTDLLLEHGGDPALADDKGHTPVEIADGNGQFEAAARLEAARDQPEDGAAADPQSVSVMSSPVPVSAPESPEMGASREGEAVSPHRAIPRWDDDADGRSALIRDQAPQISSLLDGFDNKLAVDPGNVAVLKSRGIMLAQVGLNAAALQTFNKIVEIDGGDADVFSYTGSLILNGAIDKEPGREKEDLLGLASGAFQKALEMDPRHVDAATGMGTLFYVISDFRQATAYCKRATSNDTANKSGKAWYILGLITQSEGGAFGDIAAQKMFENARKLGFDVPE